jgi:hypothetical protein
LEELQVYKQHIVAFPNLKCIHCSVRDDDRNNVRSPKHLDGVNNSDTDNELISKFMK